MNKIRERLKQLRNDGGKTQKEIAKFLNIAETTYASYEQGKAEPNIDSLIKLSNFYGVTIDYLVGKSDY